MKKQFSIILLILVIPLLLALCSTTQETGKLKYGCISGNCENGQGTYINDDGSSYAGQWKNSKPHGKGTKTDPDGKKYSGQFKNGKASGEGVLYSPDGSVIRKGMWKEGKSVGQ